MRISGILLLVLLLSGCFQMRMLPYMDQGLTLQDLSNEKEAQGKHVAATDANFDKLLAAAISGDIQKYTTESDVIKAFGPPIASFPIEEQGKTLKRSLYRYAIQSRGPHKVYMYYDTEGRLVRFESI